MPYQTKLDLYATDILIMLDVVIFELPVHRTWFFATLEN